jgi:F0F1-type ATP synthase assembly protein I
MYRIEVLQNQWVLMALLGGISSMLLLVLAYLGMWRPREKPTTEPTTNWSGAWKFMPWFLIVTIVYTAIFMLIYTYYFITYPPNW